MPADSVNLLADDLSIKDRKNVDVGNLGLLAIRGRSGEETLAEQEIFWRDHQCWLEGIGYILRWRYHANWLPSWLTDPLKSKFLSEDVLSRGLRGSLLDAIRVSDGKLVALKKIDVSKNPDEVGIGCFFSSVALAASSKNKCIPFYDILQIPGSLSHALLVMPLMPIMRRAYNSCTNKTSLTVIIKVDNIMSDTLQLYQTLPHPASRSKDRSGYGKPKLAWIRSEKPVKHYLIDFGISRYYPEGSPRLRRAGFSGVARCVPEFRENSNLLCDPFAVDVFCAGHLIRTILQVGDKLCGTVYRSLEFLDDLVVDMVQDNPGKRPTMDEVVRRFADIVRGLDSHKFGSRAVPVNERLSLWMRFLKIVGLPNTNRDQYVTTI